MSLTSTQILSSAGMMLLLVVPVTFAGISENTTPANASKTKWVDLKVGEQFLPARARILKLGWMPIAMHQNDDYEYDGTEKQLIRKKILEVDSCSLDAGVRCIFYYRRINQCLRVDTVGENTTDMSVILWLKECPGSSN